MSWPADDTAVSTARLIPPHAPSRAHAHDKNAKMAVAIAASTGTTAPNKRPMATSEEHSGPEGDETESANSEEQAAPVKRRRKRKHRKSTYTIRREEKELLLKEMDELSGKIADLKQRAMSAGVIIDKELVARKATTNTAMRRGLRGLRLVFNEVSAAMAECAITNVRAGSPFHDALFLRKDQESRHETLCALKAGRLRRAKRFLQLRRPDVNPNNVMVEDQHFETDDGDLFSTRFAVTQFRGARSVKQVFDQLLFFYCNMEISVSEKIGHITIREDDDCPGRGITQNRLVSVTSNGVKMDSNMVIFSDYSEREDAEAKDTQNTGNGNDGGGDGGGGEDHGYGFIVVDFVDDDERHPYQSDQRVRKDLSAVLELRTYPGTSEAAVSADGMTVVLTKWVQSRLHHPHFPMRPDRWVELRDSMDLWGEVMQRTVSEGLQS